MTPLYTAEQTRTLDHAAIEGAGIPGYTLMCRAGAAAFGYLRERWPDARKLHVVCGTGNNGGDGWVIGRLARMAGMEVMVDLAGREDRIHGDARQAMYDYIEAGGNLRQLHDDTPCDPGDACVIVDALVGTGFRGQLRPEYLTIIEHMNQCQRPVLAVDCPSGLDVDLGIPGPIAVVADLTVTFIGRNQGLYTGTAVDYTGDVIFDDLGIPESVYTTVTPSALLLDLQGQRAWLPRRRRSSHKGQSGHVLVVGGNQGMGGAGILAAEAALRMGAGLVTLATHPDSVSAALARRPEIMAVAVKGTRDLKPLVRKANTVVIGPGLGIDPWGQALLGEVLDAALPTVFDADALNLMAGMNVTLMGRAAVLTPHPGEAGRLLGRTTAAINADRFAAARALADRWSSEVILKGAGSLISSPNHPEIGVSPYGNPGMASGGMGDVLAGIIGGLLAQGVTPARATSLGCCLHGHAADRAAQTLGEHSLLATDVIAELPAVLRSISAQR